MRICMVGTRDLSLPPDEGLILYRRAACVLAQQGYTIVSIPSAGACRLAAESALVAGGRVDLIWPWQGYEFAFVAQVEAAHRSRITVRLFDLNANAAWLEEDEVIHPGHKKLGEPDMRHLACIYGIVSESDGLIALPRVGEEGFEVAPAIRIARALEIPLLVLTDAADRARLEAMLGGIG